MPRGAVATTFSGDGGFIRFPSPDLPSGEAGFCQSPGTGLVYITFTSSPAGCVSVRLFVVGGFVSICLEYHQKLIVDESR
jgi:hypothetical protein